MLTLPAVNRAQKCIAPLSECQVSGCSRIRFKLMWSDKLGYMRSNVVNISLGVSRPGSPRYARIPVRGGSAAAIHGRRRPRRAWSGNALKVRWNNHLRDHSHQSDTAVQQTLPGLLMRRKHIGGQVFTQNSSKYLSFCAQRSCGHSICRIVCQSIQA